jgi:hypothetical protein
MSSYRPIRWEGARTAASGLVVAFFSGRDPLDVDHDEPDRYQYEVTETRSGVGVTVIEESRPGDVGGGLGYMRALDVDLSSPLGQRILTDESSGETREAFDERRLLRSPTQSAWKAVTEGGSQWEWTTTHVNEWRLSTAAYIDVTIRGGIRAELNPELITTKAVSSRCAAATPAFGVWRADHIVTCDCPGRRTMTSSLWRPTGISV